MRNEDESNRTSTDINFKYTSQNKDGINGGKYVPTRIQFMVKNESILVPEDTETDISVTKNKDKLELRYDFTLNKFIVLLITLKLKMITNILLMFIHQIANYIEIDECMKGNLTTF